MKLSGQILANIDPEISRQLREITPKVAKKDVNVWVTDNETANRLNWIDLPTKSRDFAQQWLNSNCFMRDGWLFISP